QDPLASETYFESSAELRKDEASPIKHVQIEDALVEIKGDFGPKVKADKNKERFHLSGVRRSKVMFSSKIEVLEKDKKVFPLSSFDPCLKDLAKFLSR
ncbi:unnamed protein product, partial [marine sediment metagenome]